MRHLRAHGCELLREGARHSVWWNPAHRRTSTVPRHVEVDERLAAKICGDLGVPEPR